MTDFGSDYVLGRIAVSFMKTADALRTYPGQTVIPRLNFATGGIDKNSINSTDTPAATPVADTNNPVGQGSQLLPPAAAGTTEAPGTSATFTSEGATAPATRSNAPVVQAQPAWGEMTAQQRRERQDTSARVAAERSKRIREYDRRRVTGEDTTKAQQAKQGIVDKFNDYRKNNPLGADGFSANMSPDQALMMGANLRANGALAPGGFRGVTDEQIDARVGSGKHVYTIPSLRDKYPQFYKNEPLVTPAQFQREPGKLLSVTAGTNSQGRPYSISMSAPRPTESASPAEARQAQDQAAPVASAPNGLNPNLPTQQGASSTPAEAPQQGASVSPQPGAVASAPTAPKAPTAPVAPAAPTPAASKPSGSGTSSLPFQAKGKS